MQLPPFISAPHLSPRLSDTNPTNAAQLSIQDVRSRTNCYRIPRSAQTFHFLGFGVCGFPLHLNTARRRRSELA
ncbi:hypothetical protein E2C01_043869 [Portunus trituberculatus]|uniref:Uncharacterized protein n=1 Tax=Portunus trituberculatus TaxID=210409 RepID=A0A5B7FXA2_PORTR|nr:hypothetical protein [Portunus trituberculatus]